MINNRRDFIKLCGIGSLTLTSTNFVGATQIKEQKNTLELTSDLVAASMVWAQSQTESPSEYLSNMSTTEIESKISEDFNTDDTFSVNGWVLSKTEVAVAALFALQIKRGHFDYK